MKQKLLKLIKILNRFTIDDLITMSELEEADIRKLVQELLQDKVINHISKTEYAYIKPLTSISPIELLKENGKFYPKTPKRKIDISEINIEEFFPRKDETAVYNNAPEWAKAPLIKYTTILRLAGGLKGNSLKQFIEKLNTEHPEYKTSYSTIQKLRSKYLKYGLKGLIPEYDRNGGKSVVPPEMYEEFKKLYLNQNRYSVRKCLRIMEKNNNYGIMPTGGCFKRLLLREYSAEVIEQLRNIPLQLPTLKVEIPPIIVPKEKDMTNRTESFLIGARYYLKEIKNKKSESEICRYGYIKNHLIPYYRDFKFKDITQEVISKYVSSKLAEGYSIASIGRFISTLSIIFDKYSIAERQFDVTNFVIPQTQILTESEILEFTKDNSPELWYLALGIKPAELDALTYSDIDFENKIIKINKIRVNGKIQKYRTLYQQRELRIPNIIFSKLQHNSGKVFNEVNSDNYDIFINTHIKLMLNKNVQMNIISKNLGFQSVADFEDRYNFLLPQKLDDGFEIL